MAENELTGTNKLAERILADARADAEKTAADAQAAVDALRSENEKTVAARRKDFEAKRTSAVASVLDGCRTRAALDGRKAALSRKRVVIDEVFDKAYAALSALDGAARAAVLKRMLDSDAEAGETVIPAKCDRAALMGLAADARCGKLNISEQDAAIDGGFILAGSGYEKDCSFRALLADLRDAEETSVAGLLFETNGRA